VAGGCSGESGDTMRRLFVGQIGGSVVVAQGMRLAEGWNTSDPSNWQIIFYSAICPLSTAPKPATHGMSPSEGGTKTYATGSDNIRCN
jgi:hypothetical protein